MSIRYLRDRKRFRFEFEATVSGQRLRASKLLPAGWSKAQADAFDKKESARLFAEASGVQRPAAKIEQAVALYIKERCPSLKNGKTAIEELSRFYHAYQGRNLEELAEVAREYAELETGNLKPATIRNRLAYLRAACRYAHKFHSLGEHDPAERMQMPKVKNERHYYASRLEMLTIAKQMKRGEARAVVRIGFYSGMRLGEIIDAKQFGENALLLEDTKNGDRAVIPMHPRIRCCMKYFPLQFKKRWIQRQFEQAREAAGLGHLHFHDLRHSAASEMINNGATLYEVAGVLRHRDHRSTKRYAHLATETIANAIGLIGKKSRTG